MNSKEESGAALSTAEIEINGEVYVKKWSQIRESVTAPVYVIVRTNSAGVFAGYLKKRKGQEVVLSSARRLWYWKGAASLSQLAMEGTKAPGECKFPCCVDEVILTQAIEIIACSERARESIEGVAIWKL